MDNSGCIAKKFEIISSSFLRSEVATKKDRRVDIESFLTHVKDEVSIRCKDKDLRKAELDFYDICAFAYLESLKSEFEEGDDFVPCHLDKAVLSAS